jgi:hypothetical protein
MSSQFYCFVPNGHNENNKRQAFAQTFLKALFHRARLLQRPQSALFFEPTAHVPRQSLIFDIESHKTILTINQVY